MHWIKGDFMEKNNNRKIMLFGILGLLIVLCILGFWFVFDKKEEVKEESPGYKSNHNINVIKDQTIGVFKFTNVSLNYKDGNSVLRVNVTNTSDDLTNLKEFKIHVYGLNKEEIVTLIGFVGDKLASNETKSIESSFAGDLSNASSIEYEIVE